MVRFGTDPLADLSAVKAGLVPRTAEVDECAESRIIERILAAYRKAKADQKGAPPAYQPGGAWRDCIERRDGANISLRRALAAHGTRIGTTRELSLQNFMER